MTGSHQRLRGRLGAAVALPRHREWLFTAVVLVVFVALAMPLGSYFDLLVLEQSPSLGWMPLRVLLLPALAEELFFRVLANPHPSESVGRTEVVTSAVLSLGAYVLIHPLAGIVSRAPTPFLDPVFLLLVALLGAACLLLYRMSGSLWPPVVLHWLVATGWLALGGRGLLTAP